MSKVKIAYDNPEDAFHAARHLLIRDIPFVIWPVSTRMVMPDEDLSTEEDVLLDTFLLLSPETMTLKAQDEFAPIMYQMLLWAAANGLLGAVPQ